MNLPVNELKFHSDTAERKRWFKAASFAHPAKMVLGLQIYLIEHYTKPGETILDPMAGSGTILVGCALGRNVVCVELEEKFVKMIEANWEKIRSLGPMLGYTMGEAVIFQGDSRNLDNLLVDKIVTSPPYAETVTTGGKALAEKIGSSPNSCDRMVNGYSNSPSNIGNLPYGEISAVISSPPYGESKEIHDIEFLKKTAGDASERVKTGKAKGHSFTKEARERALLKKQQGLIDNPENIGNLPYKADAVITSPPYEGAMDGGSRHTKGGIPQRELKMKKLGSYDTTNKANIGNLYAENYLHAMLQVYRQCHRVLKEKGLMVLVVKNFIRDKKIVRLDLDTIKLCEQAGFILKERLKRKLLHQSFWRIIYQKKFPDAPKIKFEDVLVFEKLALFEGK